MPTVDHENPSSRKLMRISAGDVSATKSSVRFVSASQSAAMDATLSLTTASPSRNFTRSRRPFSHNFSCSTAARGNEPPSSGITLTLSTRSNTAASALAIRVEPPTVPPAGAV